MYAPKYFASIGKVHEIKAAINQLLPGNSSARFFDDSIDLSVWQAFATPEQVPGGDAVLMEMQHFRDVHYPDAFQPVSELDPLAQEVHDLIRLEPDYTGPLRQRAIAELACTKSKFDTALKKLQVSLNIVRSNDPKRKNDFWFSMREVHLDLVWG